MRLPIGRRNLRPLLGAWARSERGTIAILFGLMLVPLLCATGLAIDSARAYRTSGQVGAALDAAALAAAKAMQLEGLTDDEVRERAAAFFNDNLLAGGAKGVELKDLDVDIDRPNKTVALSVDASVPTTIGRLMLVEKFDIPKSSTAVFVARNLEVSLMLDISGSMLGSKLADLKTATSSLVDIVLAANGGGMEHRIALAPYSTAVNIGPYSSKAKGGPDKNSCVTERPGKAAFKDDNPGKGKFGKKAWSCPASQVTPLSDDAKTLKDAIDDMQAGGATAGHLGIAWSWYLISPDWDEFWPEDSAPKSAKERNKVAVIMTDGMFNTAYEATNGASDEQAQQLCANMKAAGVTLYAVGFEAPPEVLPTLKACASSPTHYFEATDGASLISSFKEIARQLGDLRLTQ